MSIKKRFFDSLMPIYIENRVNLETKFLQLLTTEMTLLELFDQINTSPNDKEIDLYTVRQITLGLLHANLVVENTQNILCPKYKTSDSGIMQKSTNISNSLKNYKQNWTTGIV